MTRAILVLAVAACGRINFGPGAPGDGGNDDVVRGDGRAANDTLVMLSASGSCPAIAADGNATAPRFGVVWRDAGTVWFVAVDDAGVVVQGPLSLAGGLMNLDCPAIAWSATEFVVAYSHGMINKADLDVISVDQLGAGGASTVIADAADSVAPQVAALGGRGIVAWHQIQGANTSVLSRDLVSGAPISAAATLSGISTTNGAPSVVATDDGFVVSWIGADAVHQRSLDLAAVPAGPETSFPSLDAVSPLALAWSGADVVVSWRQFAADTFMIARLKAGGTMTMPPTVLSYQRVRARSIVGTGEGVALLWVDMFGSVEYNFALLDAAGQVISHEVLTGHNPTTTSRGSLARVGRRFLAAVDTLDNKLWLRVFDR